MSNTLVTQRDEFECAYVMAIGDEPPILHSHHYRVEVSVSGDQRLEDHNVIIEFDEFKKLIKSVLPDNAFVYNSTDSGSDVEHSIAKTMIDCNIKVVKYDFTPSAENLVMYLATILQQLLNKCAPGVTVIEVKLRETANSFATWSLK